jgi:hypothetical protein
MRNSGTVEAIVGIGEQRGRLELVTERADEVHLLRPLVRDPQIDRRGVGRGDRASRVVVQLHHELRARHDRHCQIAGRLHWLVARRPDVDDEATRYVRVAAVPRHADATLRDDGVVLDARHQLADDHVVNDERVARPDL